jgi:hypothetical protein
MDYKQFLEIYNAGPEATYKLLMSIMDLNALLLKRYRATGKAGSRNRSNA